MTDETSLQGTKKEPIAAVTGREVRYILDKSPVCYSANTETLPFTFTPTANSESVVNLTWFT